MKNHIDNPHSANLRLHRRMDAPGSFFVTKTLQPRKLIISAQIAEIIAETWSFYVQNKKIYLGAFVVMPDHWHVLLATSENTTLPACIRAAARWISRHTNEHIKQHGCRWQDGYYDTRIRSAKQFEFVRNYIEMNPVRAELVQQPEEWPWSSANIRYKKHLSDAWPCGF